MFSMIYNFLPRSDIISPIYWGYESLLNSLDTLSCIFLLVYIVGFLLASFNEQTSVDSPKVLWMTIQLLPIAQIKDPRSVYIDPLSEVYQIMNKFADKHKNKPKKQSSYIPNKAFMKALVDSLIHMKDQCIFYSKCFYLSRIAESRRQFFYMLQKLQLGININRGETEVDTYIGVKVAMEKQHRWPFSFEVADIKAPQIICQGKRAYPMSSYSYLDMLREPRVQQAAIEAARTWSTGVHGARMLGGNILILRELEKVVGKFFGREDSQLCASGFLATMSSVCIVAKKGDLVIGDSRAHASLRSGMKLCGAKTLFFKHNDYLHLCQLLKRHRHKYRHTWIIIESVYSMDGDIADLPKVRHIADEYKCKIILDEAHGLGVLGKTGRGLEEHYNMPFAADIICGTFSKSLGGIGGYITCDSKLVKFLDFHSPGNVFSAPLTAYSAGGVLKAFELLQGPEQYRVLKAQENSRYFRQLLETGGGFWRADYDESLKYVVEGLSCTTVIPIVFPNDVDRVFRIAVKMLDKGFMVAAAAFPACPLERPRLRITATSCYTKDMMDKFVEILVKVTMETLPTYQDRLINPLQAD